LMLRLRSTSMHRQQACRMQHHLHRMHMLPAQVSVSCLGTMVTSRMLDGIPLV
jgi:hypothetical protein